MMKTDKLARIAGGRGFLDPLSLALMLPLMMVSSLLTVNHADIASLIAWIAANFIAFAACAAVIVPLIRIPFKNRAITPVPIAVVVAVGAILGFIKGLVTSIVAWRLGFFAQFPNEFLSRIAQTTLVGVTAIPVLAVLSDFRFRYQEEQDLLVLQKVRVALEKNQVQSGTAALDDKSKLLNFIQQAKTAVSEGITAEAALLIRNIIEKNLRPLSHKLWDVESAKLENYKFRSLVQLGMRNYPFMIKPLALVYAPMSVLFLAPKYGIPMALGSAAISTAAAVSIYLAAKVVKPVNSQISLWLFALINAVATSLVMVSPSIIYGQDSTTWNASLWLSTFILLFEIGFVSSFISAAIANHNMTRKQLDTMFDKNRAKSLLENRELANFLHGNVQNRLLAIALMLESKQVGLDAIVDELDRVEKLLLGEFNRTNKKNDSSLIGSLELLRDRWLGFVAIDFSLIGDQKISSKQNATLVQLVNEAITNAVRHGLAKNIQIRVTQTKHGCEIIATDDGIGLKQGARGIGGDYFDSVADLGWSLEAGEFGGTVLTLRCSS